MTRGKCQDIFSLYKYPMEEAHFFYKTMFLTLLQVACYKAEGLHMCVGFYKCAILFLLTLSAFRIIGKDFTKIFYSKKSVFTQAQSIFSYL